MNRRHFATAGLALVPTIATTSALAGRVKGGRRGQQKPRRKIVTRTFTSTRAITIPGVDDEGPAAPYPATIAVSGLTRGRTLDVNLTLHDFNHTHSSDVDVMLVSPNGQAALVMSSAGSGEASDLTITLDDQAATPLPDTTALTSGAFKPTNYYTPDELPAPAPQGITNTALAVFRDTNPNGRWKLFVADHAGGDTGRISDGWSLTIRARIVTRG